MAYKDELKNLIDRASSISSPADWIIDGSNIDEINRPNKIWINDVDIFCNKYLKTHSLYNRMKSILFHRGKDAFEELYTCLLSIQNDEEFTPENPKRLHDSTKYMPKNNAANKKYDVFLSHANLDKTDIVEELYNSIKKLGINIFYDKEEIEWGDDWKKRINDGIEISEFAIIVLSKNFFGREWTENELNIFLNRQNSSGQKIILPILYNVAIDEIKARYPKVADIQAIESSKYTTDQIALMFAKILIQRLKGV